jgi:cytochrome c oxidase assembly protein subunit 15
MNFGRYGTHSHPVSAETPWRRRFSVLTILTTIALISWGGFVTSINAGMAVPDWPATFGSYDPFRTGLEGWWQQTPVLAEHGHRLLGALVGILTTILAVWTWVADPRRWMRILGVSALVLVIVQGILGGVRVTENSVLLAMVHACTAQIFFALLVAMALFTTETWMRVRSTLSASARATSFRRLAVITTIAIYAQIVLGALLRHLGHGIDGAFAAIHITGAFVVTGLVFAVFVYVQKHFADNDALTRWTWLMLGAIGLQFALGLAAYLVLLHEMSMALRTNLQIFLTAAHLVMGALLLGTAVATTLLALRASAPAPSHPSPGDGSTQEPLPARTASVPTE